MKRGILVATLALLALTDKGAAHEFWIDPQDYTIAEGENLVGDLRVGEGFSGSSMSFLPRNFVTFEVISGDATMVAEGRLGDIPALNMPGLPEGLAIVVHETTRNRLAWTDWERFFNFAVHKDLGDVTALHEARGLPQEDVIENYYRFAKSLVAVGEGAGEDRRVGLRTEFVALANPYTDDVSGGLPVQLWYEGETQADYQVELFTQDAAGEVTITYHRTDADGVALLPVEPGMTYMVDSVFLAPLEPSADSDAIWATYWANLTFSVPE